MSAEPSRDSVSSRPPRRRGTREATRRRLLEVTVDLLRREGLGALTTVRITKEAGIAQSGFYMHFKNMDDCIGAAAEQISEGVRATIDASRKGKLSQYRSWADLQRTDVVAAHFDHVLRTYEEERGLTEIFLRYRRDPSVLGETLRRLEDEAHRKVLEDMWAVGKRLGLQAHHYEDVVLHCEFLLGMLQRATELLLSGRYASRKQLVWKLARMTQATMIAEVALATGASRGKSST